MPEKLLELKNTTIKFGGITALSEVPERRQSSMLSQASTQLLLAKSSSKVKTLQGRSAIK
jgi:hypothetical protein